MSSDTVRTAGVGMQNWESWRDVVPVESCMKKDRLLRGSFLHAEQIEYRYVRVRELQPPQKTKELSRTDGGK